MTRRAFFGVCAALWLRPGPRWTFRPSFRLRFKGAFTAGDRLHVYGDDRNRANLTRVWFTPVET